MLSSVAGSLAVLKRMLFLFIMLALLWPGPSTAIYLPKVDESKDCSNRVNGDLVQKRMLKFYSNSPVPVWMLVEFDLLGSGYIRNLELIKSSPDIIDFNEAKNLLSGRFFQKGYPQLGCQLLLAHIPISVP